jgi:chemotaxis protein methyltransferase CheR
MASDPASRRNGETYFFRDHGQFDLLRLRLLPELIERRRQAKTLRLWSAGCSSGEEAYSLAILVDLLLPRRDGWDILILGSDIDQPALEKARRGRYGQWSFRMAAPSWQQQYFRRQRDEWVLEERLRSMVTFRAGDLLGKLLAGGEWREMDLILCRNVFIYFDTDAVTMVAAKLADALSAGGYLMTGHTELIGHRVQNLQCRLFTEGVVYQRVSARPAKPPPLVRPPPPPPAVVQPRPPCQPPPVMLSGEELLATARGFADRGEYERAAQICQQALDVTPLAAGPHFLLAQLAQLRGDFKRAGELLTKTLYLDPRSVAAYLELAALCERTENLPRAQTLRRAALDIVRTLPDDAAIEPYETTAAEMAQWLAQ